MPFSVRKTCKYIARKTSICCLSLLKFNSEINLVVVFYIFKVSRFIEFPTFYGLTKFLALKANIGIISR